MKARIFTLLAIAALFGAIAFTATSGAFAQSDPYNGSLIDRIVAQQGTQTSGGNDDDEDDDEEDDAEDEDTEAEGADDEDHEFTTNFRTENCTFADTGSNAFFILEPGYQLTLEGEEDGEQVELIVTVLNETKDVDGVTTRVVEERESAGGELVEVSRNFFAICEETGSVFYFGEEVDDYDEGEIVGHEGAWLAGKNDAKAGIIMPGTPLLGARYFQEIAPEVAMDRAEIIEDDEELETPAGTFENVLVIRETTPLEPGVEEFKYHAAGIGLIQDADLKLMEYGFVEE
jgi:hypothetical protein